MTPTPLQPVVFALALSLVTLSSRAAEPSQPSAAQSAIPAPDLPASVAMNKDAGRGGLLFVSIRVNGRSLPFVVDTGCPTTCLDQSLEPQLGQRIRTEALWAFGVKSAINVYRAPALYWGKTRLAKIGPYVVTHDCSPMSKSVGRRILGVLGVDVLQNYCIQLDFAADKIRFLDPHSAGKRNWGLPFPLWTLEDGCPAIAANLTGRPGPGSIIDTGCNYDGWLTPQLFQQWTNPAAPLAPGEVLLPNATLGGRIYHDVELRGVNKKLLHTGDTHIRFNGIGLLFLARHLVTLDFPDETLFLKRTYPPTRHFPRF
jgi:hypothetical protein